MTTLSMWRRVLLGLAALGLVIGATVRAPSAQSSSTANLTVAVLVDSRNSSGYNTSPTAPGEFQRYPQLLLDHLQVPYEVIDVSQTAPPDLSARQLVVVGHRGVGLSSNWQNAIVQAVNAGTGFVNFDWDPAIGAAAHMQAIFGATGSAPGPLATSISVPQAVIAGGSSPHYIAQYQRKFRGDPAGDIVYNFHEDDNGVVNGARSTVLTGASGTIIARLGSAPLIVVKSYGSGRAVHVGTLDVLRPDRFGFLQGIDDLLWRSLVWAARKPFVLRGYPRFWAVQFDDTRPEWGFRVRDLYDPALTGSRLPNGVGGPWKVTGYVFLNNLQPGTNERAAVAADIRDGKLQISPHSFNEVNNGDFFWNPDDGGPLSDTQVVQKMDQLATFLQGNGGTDALTISKSIVPHTWNISPNMGYDLYERFGIRYITAIMKPGYASGTMTPTGEERLSPRPYWRYERPPKNHVFENAPFFFADDYTLGSRAGLPARTFSLFATQVIDFARYAWYPYYNEDVDWPADFRNWSVADSVDQFQWTTWRLWSSLAPVEIYTHDAGNMSQSTDEQRRQVVSQVSSWLNGNGVRHVFMQDLAAYVHARRKSRLVAAQASTDSITYTFTGDSIDADGTPLDTEVLVFKGDDNGVAVTIPGFRGGLVTTKPIPVPSPLIVLNPTSAQVSAVQGGAAPQPLSIGVGNAGDAALHWTAASDAAWLTVSPSGGTDAGTITAAVNHAGLAPGTYTGHVSVSDPAAPNSPQSVTVQLTVYPAGTFFVDDFTGGASSAWTSSPLGNASGWAAVGGTYEYNGLKHTQRYTGDPSWDNYSFEAQIRLFSLSGTPGGLRARVNPQTGAGYAAWLYPQTGEIKLWRATGWDIDSAGLVLLGSASGIVFDTTAFHTLKLVFVGSLIEVWYDGVLRISVQDTSYTAGVVALDVSTQRVAFDNIAVKATPPTLRVTPSTLGFSAVAGGPAPSATTLSIARLGGSGELAWSANVDAGWLTASPRSGSTPASTTVSANPSGLPEGRYTASVVVTASDAAVAPVTVPVTLNVYPPGTLFVDDFSGGSSNWTASPLGRAGGWSVVNGAFRYNGGGHTQMVAGDAAWTDYTVQASITLSSLNNFPGGLRARVDPATGASYTVWLYPGSGQIKLLRTTAWAVDSPGLAVLGTASGVGFTTGTPLAVALRVVGSQLEVRFGGTTVISATDSTLTAGRIALDVSNQVVTFDDVRVSAP